MLQSLYIQNYALIETLDINFQSGFSVITGETGAGKSIILGAIGLLLGQRADIKSIRHGANKCIVEAHFDINSYPLDDFFQEEEIENDGQECILRRELYASGKSRAFINDTPATLAQMKVLGERLIDVHSQHQNLLLNQENFQLDALDVLARNNTERDAYEKCYFEYRKVSLSLEELIEKANDNQRDTDYISFQLKQLEEANLKAGEQEELEQESEMLSHAEDIKSALYKVEMLIESDDNNILSMTRECTNTLQSLSRVYSPSQEWIERMESCYIELKELSRDLSRASDQVEYNPERMEYVNERLNLIYSLQQKHRVQSVDQLIAIAEEYRSQLDDITSYDERIAQLEKQKEKLYQELLALGKALTETRIASAHCIETEMQSYLIPLGMPNVRFEVEMTERKEPSPKGMDNVTFLFSANKSGSLQPVSSIASGGEVARVMLSLKAIMTSAIKLPTIIFDEIDTGVSGAIADKMAHIMREMGKDDRQVISITHLPQIAAKGKAHYKVYKEDTDDATNSHIRQLSEEERINEIAVMLSGSTLTEAALNNAKALLNDEIL